MKIKAETVFALARIGLKVAETLSDNFGSKKITVGGVEIDLDDVDVISFKEKVMSGGATEEDLQALENHIKTEERGEG